jgi:hypothetical protein
MSTSKDEVLLQPKLTMNPSNDLYEKEADSVADKVVQLKNDRTAQQVITPLVIQRKCSSCEEELQRKEDGKSDEHEAPAIITGALGSCGTPLGEETKSFMENRFGYDFSDVKIHTGNVASKSAQAINALAYTTGNNIVFNEGQYSPGTVSGKKLLAHELTHVIQQKNAALQTRLQRQEDVPVMTDDFEYHFAGPCFRPYFPGIISGGSVTFRGCSGHVTDFSLISEDRNTADGSCILITPVDGVTYSVRGFWYRHHTPMNEWFKIGDHCDVIVDCSAHRIEVCCHAATELWSRLRGGSSQPYWTGEHYSNCANPFSADPLGANCNPNPLGSALPPVGTAHRRPNPLSPCAMTLTQILADPTWCYDYFQNHRGETCYRRIPTMACGPSDQYCFTATGCCHSSPDSVSPVEPTSPGAGATCDNNASCVAQHVREDVY